MSFVVKNTTLCSPLDLLCPHSCRGCGQLGVALCGCCKNNIIIQQKTVQPPQVAELAALHAVGWREGALAKCVKDYKYQSVRALGPILAELLDRCLPEGLEDLVVVPLPTIGRHVRERGFDHTLALARYLAKRRGWRCERVLGRAADTVQVGTKAAEREAQAARAYEVVSIIDPEMRYLLLDDVWTTGASMRAAAEVLCAAGAGLPLGVVVALGKPKPAS